MKNYIVDIDFVMSKRIQVEAENEEQARSITDRLIKENPYNYTYRFDACVGHKIIDVTED